MKLVVAKVGAAVGLRGEVRLDVRTDDPAARFVPGTVFETEPAQNGPLTVARVRLHKNRYIALFEECTDRNGAESLREVKLVIDSAAEEFEEDAFYAHELKGLKAVLEDGTELGEVIDLLPGAAQDLLVVQTASVQVLVPFVFEIALEVDLEMGVVILDPPGGLFPGIGEEA